MGEQRIFDWAMVGEISVGFDLFRVERIQANDDAWRAETALATTRIAECSAPPLRARGIEPIDRRDGTTPGTAQRGDTRNSRLAVDEHRATAALALRATPVFHTGEAELIAQGAKQRVTRVFELNIFTVDGE